MNLYVYDVCVYRCVCASIFELHKHIFSFHKMYERELFVDMHWFIYLIYPYTHVYIHLYIYIYINMCIYTYIYMYINICIYSRTHAHTEREININIHIQHTHVYIIYTDKTYI